MVGHLLFLFLTALVGNNVNGYELQRVVVLGRHTLRTPVTGNLKKLSPNPWPEWKEKVGYLTEKGALLEGYMGEYFSAWLKQEGLLSEGCPSDDSVYVYANAVQRTRKTAESFVKNAFKNCNVTVHYKRNVTKDPLFDPIVRNHSIAFIHLAKKEMQQKLDESKLNHAFSMLNDILNFEHSDVCKYKSICNLTAAKEEFLVKSGEFPNMNGPLKFAYMAVDSFLAQYYHGASLDSIGWGKIKPEHWEILIKPFNIYSKVRFNGNTLSKDISRPLVSYFRKVLLHGERKFTILVGHDSNLNSVMGAMGFKDYKINNQLEKTPIGGKIVFQKWYDRDHDRYLLKINYVYQSTDQLREGQTLSLENPPESTVLELRGCDVDEDGYCLWDDFVKVAKTF